MYTLGIRFFTGRCDAALIESGRLQPQGVTTRTVEWDDAPNAFLEPAIKLVVARPNC